MATTQHHNQLFNERKRVFDSIPRKTLFNTLNTRHRHILNRHFILGMNMTDISIIEGTSVERIRQIIDYAIKRLESYNGK